MPFSRSALCCQSAPSKPHRNDAAWLTLKRGSSPPSSVSAPDQALYQVLLDWCVLTLLAVDIQRTGVSDPGAPCYGSKKWSLRSEGKLGPQAPRPQGEE